MGVVYKEANVGVVWNEASVWVWSGIRVMWVWWSGMRLVCGCSLEWKRDEVMLRNYII